MFKYDDNETWSTLMEAAENKLPLSHLCLEKTKSKKQNNHIALPKFSKLYAIQASCYLQFTNCTTLVVAVLFLQRLQVMHI